MRRALALMAAIALLMTFVVVPPAAAKNVEDAYNVMGPWARAFGSACTDDDPELGDRYCQGWQVNMHAGLSHLSWDTDKEYLKPEVCAYADVYRYDASDGSEHTIYHGGCLNGQHLSLTVAKDLSRASADATIPTITSTCDNGECTPEVPGEPIVIHVDWVGVGPVLSEKWKRNEMSGDCYQFESFKGDWRAATATGTFDGVPVVFDDELNNDMSDGHAKFELVCPVSTAP